MPMLGIHSGDIHKKIKIKAIILDSTMGEITEMYLRVGLSWELHDTVLVQAVEDLAKKKGKTVAQLLSDIVSGS